MYLRTAGKKKGYSTNSVDVFPAGAMAFDEF